MLFSIHKAEGKVLLLEFWCTVEKITSAENNYFYRI